MRTNLKNLQPYSSSFTLSAALCAILVSPAAFAGKGHGAHEHGVAAVNVVGEGNAVTVQLQAPSDSIYGFEHEAKKDADIKKRDAAIEKLKSHADKIFVLDASLGCKLASSDIKPFVTDGNEKKDENAAGAKSKHKEGTHSEVHATFKFECSKPVAGSKLGFAARKHFKSLRTLKIQVLSGEKQDGATIKNDKGTVGL
ncbi:MAG: DUF2796 domain-containing protein [Betaproteobacteria bacterium]|nr:DUF2796 domain-containing protein [Betaproteobacteria bacterium]